MEVNPKMVKGVILRSTHNKILNKDAKLFGFAPSSQLLAKNFAPVNVGVRGKKHMEKQQN